MVCYFNVHLISKTLILRVLLCESSIIIISIISRCINAHVVYMCVNVNGNMRGTQFIYLSKVTARERKHIIYQIFATSQLILNFLKVRIIFILNSIWNSNKNSTLLLIFSIDMWMWMLQTLFAAHLCICILHYISI